MKAISEGLIARAFYLTARTTARRAAEDALRLLRQNGLKLRAVTLTAKDKICFSPRTSCHPSECVFAQDYFDKRREALREALNLQALDRAAIEALAREYDVCPLSFRSISRNRRDHHLRLQLCVRSARAAQAVFWR